MCIMQSAGFSARIQVLLQKGFYSTWLVSFDLHQMNLLLFLPSTMLLKGYFQCLAVDPGHKYGRTHPGTRIREGYLESRYANKYPKHKHAAYEASMQGDEYSRSKYKHSYLERAHSESCPDCIRGDHTSSAYQNGHYSSGDKAGNRYQSQNGEEFSATSGSEKAYYKTVSV